jgi:DNA-binding IscR family transcriptional regulator
VVEAVDGPVRGQAPAGKGEKASPLATRLDEIYSHCAEQIRKSLGQITIAELVSG